MPKPPTVSEVLREHEDALEAAYLAGGPEAFHTLASSLLAESHPKMSRRQLRRTSPVKRMLARLYDAHRERGPYEVTFEVSDSDVDLGALANLGHILKAPYNPKP